MYVLNYSDVYVTKVCVPLEIIENLFETLNNISKDISGNAIRTHILFCAIIY